MVVAADPALAPLASSAGHTVVPAGGALDAVDAVLVDGSDAWDRVRAWRAAGLRATAIVCAPGAVPPDRASLEPVVTLKAPTPGALATALNRRGERRPAATGLAGGRFEAHHRRFRRQDGRAVELTPLETRLLAYLASRAGRPVDRDELQEEVWDHRTALDTKAVEVAVARLRRKIEPEPSAPVSLVTAPGGYRAVLADPAPRGSGGCVGRDEVIARLVDRLTELADAAGSDDGGARVPLARIALVGPPGVGKTRTAAQVAAGLDSRGIPVHLVDLDGVPARADAGVALATALDLEVPRDGDALTSVLDRLRGGVLLLDHGEQREAVVAAVLARAAGRCAVLVATQVAPDGVAIEVLPPLGDEAGAEILLAVAGGSLDRDAARRLVPGLDGLPLALTLAGSRIALLGPAAFAEALDQRLALLSPAAGGRHGWLRDAVADAVDRLSPGPRAALAALTAFHGAFGAADATALLGSDGVALLADLVGRSVLARDGGRFRVLHAFRDHVRATDGPPAAPVVGAHVDWAVARVRALVPRLDGAGARAAFAELAALYADLVAAADAAVDPADVAVLAEGLDTLLAVTGTEADRDAVLTALAPRTEADPVARARVALRQAALQVARDRARAEREAVEVARVLADADPDHAARASLLAAKLAYRHDPPGALARLLAVDPARVSPATALAVRAMEATCRQSLGERTLLETLAEMALAYDRLADLGALADAVVVGTTMVPLLRNAHPERCLPVLEQLVEWSELLRDPLNTALVKGVLATEYWRAGRRDDAHRELDAADALFARVQPAGRMRVAQRRAWIDMQTGDVAAARAGYERVLARARVAGEPGIAAEVLIHLVLVEVDADRPVAAAAHAEEAAALTSRLGRLDLAAQGGLAWGLARLLCGDAAGADQILAAVDRSQLAPSSQVSWLATSVTAAARVGTDASRLDAELDRVVAEGVGPEADDQRSIVAAGRAGRAEELAAWLDPAKARTVDLRLLARVWRAYPR